MIDLIIGGIIGFGSAVGVNFINNTLTIKKEKKNFYRLKIEEVFLLLNKIDANLFHNSLQLYSISDNSKSFNLVSDEMNSLSMLINFYFPHIETEYSKYMEICNDENIRIFNNLNKSDSKHNGEFNEKYFIEYSNFKNKVIQESKKYI